jgi:histidinol-phosphatase (PHP family)
MESDNMIDTHIHIEKGDYTLEWINQFVNVALNRGLTEIYLLEHSHRFIEFKNIYKNFVLYNDYQKSWLDRKLKLSLEDYKDFILKVNNEKFPIKIKFGLEVCYEEEFEETIKNTLDNFQWDFITGSVHWIDGWGFDHIKEHWDKIDVDKVYKRYYEIMKSLIKSQLFNIVAHPDSIKCFGYNPSYDLTETYFEIADLLNKYNVSAEQNSGLYYRYGHKDLGMNRKMYDIFKSKNIHIYTASDAHKPEDTGKYIRELDDI